MQDTTEPQKSPSRDGARLPLGVVASSTLWPSLAGGAALPPAAYPGRAGAGYALESDTYTTRQHACSGRGVTAQLPEKPGASTGSTAGWRPRPIQAGNELRKAGVPCTAGGGGTLRAPPALCASIQKNTLNSHQGRSGTQKAYRQKRWHEMTGFTGKLRKRLVQ